MPHQKYIQPFWYGLTDYVTAAIAWMLFYFLRKQILHEAWATDYKFWLGGLLIPLGWMILYGLVGSYHSIYKKSRLSELTMTFICSMIGCIVLFFLFLLDDTRDDYNYYYAAFGTLFGLHFFLTLAGRLVVLAMVKKQIVSKTVRFPTAIIGYEE